MRAQYFEAKPRLSFRLNFVARAFICVLILPDLIGSNILTPCKMDATVYNFQVVSKESFLSLVPWGKVLCKQL